MVEQDLTKARLIEAAGEEFAEKGFEAARVRSICDRAGANLAAINYHFGDKEQLYIETVLHAHRCGMMEQMPVAAPGVTPAEQLGMFIQAFLSNVLEDDQTTWQRALMLREMIRPTQACEALVRDAIRPRFERLKGILRAACPEAEERRLHALAFSVIGQCLHYKVARPISERLIGSEAYARLDREFLVEHITRFTLAALGLASPFDGGQPETTGRAELNEPRRRDAVRPRLAHAGQGVAEPNDAATERN